MNKYIILIEVALLLTGCSSFKYPNWENVKVEDSVFEQNCSFRGEEVHYCRSKWFKKRATKFDSNTVVLVRSRKNNKCLGGYFACDGMINEKFKDTDYKQYQKTGLNKVSGQGFLTQKGGGVVTCAGEKVKMFPNTKYFNYIYGIQENYIRHKPIKNEHNLVKITKCDSQGNFEFYNVPSGDWVIKTTVEWTVFIRDGAYTPPIVLPSVANMPGIYVQAHIPILLTMLHKGEY